MIIDDSCKGHISAGTAVMLDKSLAGFDAEITYSLEYDVFFVYVDDSKTVPYEVCGRLDSILGVGRYILKNNAVSAKGRPKETKGKPVLSLVPRGINECIARVREYGNKKYGSADGWKQMSRQDYWEACLRHAEKARNDIDSVDEESGLPHTWHLACNLSFILSRELK